MYVVDVYAGRNEWVLRKGSGMLDRNGIQWGNCENGENPSRKEIHFLSPSPNLTLNWSCNSACKESSQLNIFIGVGCVRLAEE
jgi:hypothetical protein